MDFPFSRRNFLVVLSVAMIRGAAVLAIGCFTQLCSVVLVGQPHYVLRGG